MFAKKVWMPFIQELNLEPTMNWDGKVGKRKVSVLENWDSVGSIRNVVFMLPLVRSNGSGVYNIFHSLWKQTQVSLDQIQKNT